ncbi:uncharacterized protein LOC117119605 [Anneissia japonica]|uniref:uncharacterized protein LOC117119605 n=1 Tax=Anneissia japonica TaxID=1529436 RepID=UPI001425BAB1|nr:uncharacterized protein LOC117119605 [Anneissia japonica]
MRQHDHTHEIAKQSNSEDDWDAYKKIRNTVTNSIRKKIKEYFTSAIETNKGDSSMLWNKPKSVPSSITSKNGKNVKNQAEIADIFNEHFSTIVGRMASSDDVTREIEMDNAHLSYSEPIQQCTLHKITEDFVRKQITSMSPCKATGPDGVSVKMIKLASPYIIKSLTHVLNL